MWVVDVCGLPVDIALGTINAKGEYNADTNTIIINSNLPAEMVAWVLFHEVYHVFLYLIYGVEEDFPKLSREQGCDLAGLFGPIAEDLCETITAMQEALNDRNAE